MTSEEPSRFGQWGLERGLWQLGGLSEFETFFAGPRALERMAGVRTAISHIRLNWDQYPKFMDELRSCTSITNV